MERTIKPEAFMGMAETAAMILNVRRDNDFNASEEIIAGASWKDPQKIDEWIGSVPKEGQVVLYCARGGGVSNSVVDRLLAEGIHAQFIEGGIEGFKSAGGQVDNKS